MTAKVYGTVDGVAITDEVISELVANAEAGFPGVVMRRGRPGRPSMGSGPARTVAVRLDPELDAALVARQRDSGQTTSEVLREALTRYLAA